MAKKDLTPIAKFTTDVATGETKDTNAEKKPTATVKVVQAESWW